MSSNNKKSLFSLETVAIVSIVLGFGVFFGTIISYSLNPSIDTERSGQMGNYISGVVGGLWLLAGIILFYMALKKQSEQLLVQQKVLNSIQEEVLALENNITQNTNVLKSFLESTNLQRFDTSFFEMLRFHSYIVNNLSMESIDNLLPYEEENVYGIDVFDKFIEIIRSNYLQHDKSKLTIENDCLYKIEHYFNSLQGILEHIDSLSPSDTNKYLTILNAHITNKEKVVIFYYGLTNNGNKLKLLIEKYSLFKHFDINKLIKTEDRNLYSNSAFN